ncbi:MAG: N-acetyltransferase, partial [Flavobacterium sp.]|nr:N-acetyltransferase [Flavobacterium sp.]MBC7847686.1 N-acetyltransferase [Flavobacterium sp.]
ELNAYHTEVNQSARGKGFAGKLLNEMVEYATNHNLKVKPSCSFVRASFEKNPEKYSTVWVKE